MRREARVFREAVHMAMSVTRRKLSVDERSLFTGFLSDVDECDGGICVIVSQAVEQLFDGEYELFERDVLYAIVLALDKELKPPSGDENYQRLHDLNTWRKSGELRDHFAEWLKNWYSN